MRMTENSITRSGKRNKPPNRRDAPGKTGTGRTGQRWYRPLRVAFIAAGPTLGDTLDAASAVNEPAQVLYVTGPLPGGGMAGFRAWIAAAGGWEPAGDQYVRADQPRLTYHRDGLRVSVQRAAAWYGETAGVNECSWAWQEMRVQASRRGWPLMATPGTTGRVALANTWAERGQSWATLPAGLADLVRATSGQGRFELGPAAKAGGGGLWRYDGRLMYGDLAMAELPIGLPEHVQAGPSGRVAGFTAAARQLPARVRVTFTVPRGWRHVGLVGCLVAGPTGVLVQSWPNRPGDEGEAWLDGSELALLASHHWRHTVREAIIWPARGRPLASWARQIIHARQEAMSPYTKAGWRNVLLHGIGALHGRPHRVTRAGMEPPADATEIVWHRDGEATWIEHKAPALPELVHPEWTAHLWARARVRLFAGTYARPECLWNVPPDQLVGCALDAIYTSAPQPGFEDDQRLGTYRLTGQWGPWPPVASMHHLYRITNESEML